MNFYPDRINEVFYAPKRCGKAVRTNSVGTGVGFVCGSFVRVFLEIDLATKEICDARYKTNGCGYAIAAAEITAEKIVGRRLTDFHGLNHAEFIAEIESELGKFGANRKHCAEMCFDALQSAFGDFRALQIEEFVGEKALICTCFGVSEDAIQKIIAENQTETVEEISDACNAGTGCGSCRFLIQELIDVYQMEN